MRRRREGEGESAPPSNEGSRNDPIAPPRPSEVVLSVVLPVHDSGDDRTEWGDEVRRRLALIPGVEVVTPDEGRTRAERLQNGILQCQADMILLHHPRSVVQQEGIEWLRDQAAKADGDVLWGGFTHKFDHDHWALRFTSWYSNRVRARRGVVYLDHCIFFRKHLLTRPIPPVAIFEDTLCSYILCESGGLPLIAPFESTTSAVRFRTNGIFRQALLNQRLKLQFYFGAEDRAMNLTYERGLRLNDTPAVAATTRTVGRPSANWGRAVSQQLQRRPKLVASLVVAGLVAVTFF